MSRLLQEFARAARVDALAEGRELVRAARENGLAEGRELARAAREEGLLIAMAGEKEVYADRAGRLFVADAGRAVREHLRGMTDPDRLHEFGRKSIDCDTLEQLMALVAEDASNGHCPG